MVKSYKNSSLLKSTKGNEVTFSTSFSVDYLKDKENFKKSLLSLGLKEVANKKDPKYVNFQINVENVSELPEDVYNKRVDIELVFINGKANVVKVDNIEVIQSNEKEVEVNGFVNFLKNGTASFSTTVKNDKEKYLNSLKEIGFNEYKTTEDTTSLSIYLNKQTDKIKEMLKELAGYEEKTPLKMKLKVKQVLTNLTIEDIVSLEINKKH